jgi:nitronate monooxygenase
MKIKTKITEMLGNDLPIFAAPMFLVSYTDLVVAVSEAGGVGCFPSVNYRTIPELRSALEEIRSRTNKPFGVNIILSRDHNPNRAKQLELCYEFRVPLIITSMGTPRTIVKEAHQTGCRIFCDVTTLRMAEVVATSGADALIAVAQGAGGHAGAISPFSLIPYLKEATGLPVLAAGSITNGSQMAAAFALGADAVYCGTRFICTPESGAKPDYKQMIIDSKPEEIEYTDRISGIPANWMGRSLERVRDLNGENPDDPYTRWRDIWSAGHGVGQIDDIRPAEQIVREMADEYGRVLQRFPEMEKV